jgi:hypothetical protein
MPGSHHGPDKGADLIVKSEPLRQPFEPARRQAPKRGLNEDQALCATIVA